MGARDSTDGGLESGQPFYAAGLYFSCRRCSACCRYESGYVFLSKADVSRLAEKCQMGYTAFVETYCRWIPFDRGMERLSLKEKSNCDCIFWDTSTGGQGGCGVYDARPLQCRTFPFWESVLCSKTSWGAAASGCPGINSGAFHGREEIEACLCRQDDETVVERSIMFARGF